MERSCDTAIQQGMLVSIRRRQHDRRQVTDAGELLQNRRIRSYDD